MDLSCFGCFLFTFAIFPVFWNISYNCCTTFCSWTFDHIFFIWWLTITSGVVGFAFINGCLFQLTFFFADMHTSSWEWHWLPLISTFAFRGRKHNKRTVVSVAVKNTPRRRPTATFFDLQDAAKACTDGRKFQSAVRQKWLWSQANSTHVSHERAPPQPRF